MSQQSSKHSANAKQRPAEGPALETQFRNGALNGFGAPVMGEQFKANALMGADAVQATLTMWRTWLDISRNVMRAQQDSMMHAWREQVELAANLPNYSNRAPDQSANMAPPQLFAAAAKAYESIGETLLQAQHDAIDALTHPRH